MISQVPVDMTAKKFAEKLSLTAFHTEEERLHFANSDVHRPGLQLAGFFDYFAAERLQVIGKAEMSYLSSLAEPERYRVLDRYFQHDIPALVLCRGYQPLPEMLELAKAYHRPLFGSTWDTARFVHLATSVLDIAMAPRISMHGVLLDVHGVGVMLVGESGIGKSETSLELVKRGHRLVADDVVDITAFADGQLIGKSPRLIRHFMEIRGIGIIDVKSLYGTGAVRMAKTIELVIQLEDWDENKEYERLGLDTLKIDILGVKVPQLILPVKPGRNLAIIVEVAARNFRQQKLGYSAAEEIERRVTEEADDE